MEAINSFNKLFLEVWNEGIFGLNASEIIIGFIIFLVFYVLRRLFARFIISKLNKLVNLLLVKSTFIFTKSLFILFKEPEKTKLFKLFKLNVK